MPTWCQREACSDFNDFCGHAADQPWASVKRCVDGSPGCCSYPNTFFFMHCRSSSAIRRHKTAKARLPRIFKAGAFSSWVCIERPVPPHRLDPGLPSNKSLLRIGQKEAKSITKCARRKLFYPGQHVPGWEEPPPLWSRLWSSMKVTNTSSLQCFLLSRIRGG